LKKLIFLRKNFPNPEVAELTQPNPGQNFFDPGQVIFAA